MTHPYTTANGDTIDLAIKNEVMMAHVCHYVMTHTANKLFLNTPPSKKQFGLKKGLRLFGQKGETTVRKELTQFHTLKCLIERSKGRASIGGRIIHNGR